MTIDKAFKLAILNVGSFGDTDIFPSPIDRFLCQDKPVELLLLLKDIHKKFDQSLATEPPENINALAPLGYTAFRWATEIDSQWNLYLLAMVLLVAEAIESQRLPETASSVFSYRFSPDFLSGHLFAESTWRHYKQAALRQSKEFEYVLVADIADFYNRVGHHRLENGLQRLQNFPTETVRIMALLKKFTQTRSSGLPIGGPASRILAELALNPIDLFLNRKGIRFCRYVDDFHIFAKSKQEAFNHLAFLAKILFTEGLSLQKTKTRILTTKELREASAHLDISETEDVDLLPPEARLMRLSVKYDPYSPTAEEDYEALQEAVSSIDIVGILAREIAKTNIDTQVAKQAVTAIRALPKDLQSEAIESLVKQNNLETLAPVFPSVMRLLRSVYEEMETSTQSIIDKMMEELFSVGSHLIQNEVNLSYLLPVFGMRQTAAKETILIELYDRSSSPLVRKEIILIMAKWKATYWLSETLSRYGSLSKWEKKSVIVAAHHMDDEGFHWLNHAKSTFKADELLVKKWYKERLAHNKVVPI